MRIYLFLPKIANVMRCFFFLFIFSWLESADLSVEFQKIEISKFPDVEILFLVRESSGKALQKLQRHQIDLKENLKEISNYYMEVSNDPVELAILIDDSGSMQPYMALARQAVQKFIDLLGVNDTAQVVSFSDVVSVLQVETSDKKALTSSLKRLKGYGATALYDGLYKAAEILSGQKKSAIVLLSDGMDQNRNNTDRQSKHTAIEALTKAHNKHIPIYCIGLGRKINRSELKDFARLSRGSFFYAPTANQLQDLYGIIARNLKSDVRIKYTSQSPQMDSTFRELKLEVQFENQTGSALANYYAPGRYVLVHQGFGYDITKGTKDRDLDLSFSVEAEGDKPKSGSKEFVHSWLNTIGK